MRTSSAKCSREHFAYHVLTPHLLYISIYKKGANISQTMSRTSYAKCSRTFRRPCPQQKKFFSIFFFKIYSSKRIKMTCFEKNLFSPIISEIYHFTLLTPPPPHHHHQSRNDISTTQVSKISTCTLTITCLPTKKKFEKIFLINMFITYFGPSRVLTLYIRALGSTRI